VIERAVIGRARRLVVLDAKPLRVDRRLAEAMVIEVRAAEAAELHQHHRRERIAGGRIEALGRQERRVGEVVDNRDDAVERHGGDHYQRQRRPPPAGGPQHVGGSERGGGEEQDANGGERRAAGVRRERHLAGARQRLHRGVGGGIEVRGPGAAMQRCQDGIAVMRRAFDDTGFRNS
jgi:hypothetical protein